MQCELTQSLFQSAIVDDVAMFAKFSNEGRVRPLHIVPKRRRIVSDSVGHPLNVNRTSQQRQLLMKKRLLRWSLLESTLKPLRRLQLQEPTK